MRCQKVVITTQRRNLRRGKLTEDQMTRLNELAFQWTVFAKHGRPKSEKPFAPKPIKEESADQEWEVMFVALQGYKDKYGNCLVPQRWQGNHALADWVSNQRSAYRRKQLDPDLAERLDEIGFTWDPVSMWWERKFQQLLEFKREHGHTNVPQRCPQYPELATWVHNQRHAKWHNKPIMAEREKRLDEIGFVWRFIERNVWGRMFERMMEFRKVHGHCNVPQKSATNRKLGRWVNVQRLFYMRGKLRHERQKRLEAVGFVWNMKKPASTESMGQLDLHLG